MASVMAIVKRTKQPHGGFVRPSSLIETSFSDGEILAASENIPATTIGMVVDYMARFMNGASLEEAFKIPLAGAMYAQQFGVEGAMKKFLSHINAIHGLDDESIIHACQCVAFDVWVRDAAWAIYNHQMNPNPENISPDFDTIHNIRILVNRGIFFFKSYGPIIKDGFTFSPNGYTDIVTAGDGDFLTSNTLWDFKVSKRPPTSQNTLQLLMYYIMGKHSGNPVFTTINNIGIFNPRLNIVYTADMANISKDVLQTVEHDVIGFKTSLF